ncbi:MAG: ATP-dependent Clp protease ATP-binding subunit [Bacteriovoracaceae bacterium]
MNQFDTISMGSIEIAQSQALKMKHPELHPLHLLFGLISNPQSFSSRNLKQYKSIVEGDLKKLPHSSGTISLETLKANTKFSEWITLASSHAIQAGRKEISEADLIRFIPQILPELEIDYNLLNQNMGTEDIEVPSFLVNLNEMAEKGKLDPVIGRTPEIRAVMEILGRRGKNNPVLVGPAGVGKTAIVEGLAEAIVKGGVPDVLKGKTVYSMDMGSLMAGTKYRGDFEERIQKLLKFVKGQVGDCILFIDEIHQLVGAGRTDGAMDAANLLKPALARGELHCIGATTPEEFQKYILGDAALERRFRPVKVEEPSKEDAIEIMMGVREKLEIHHGIKISDEAIYSSVLLSDQYLTDKNLPDKSIDLVDEAASSMKLSAEAMPSYLAELESEIRSKSILAKVEKDNLDILADIEQLKMKFTAGKKEWEKEVLSLKKVSEIKNQVDKLKFDLDVAQRNGNYDEASKIKYSLIPAKEKELSEYKHDWILKPKHIAEVIARQTGIPVEKILKTKQDNILGLEKFVNERVFGQKEAVHEISETLIASHAGLTAEKRPLGSFMLLGPTGVGKTETAKAIAQYLFESEDAMIRLDMSEFSEKHSVSKLIGAPAGYVGYDEGGVLTEAIRRKPYAVILFDEIEKAHHDFSDILLQILDDGRLTDNKGRTVNFKNTIIMMTSNSKNPTLDFKPEVLGRLDGVLNFHALDRSIMSELIMKEVKLLNERLRSKKLILKLDASATEILGEQGYNETYGARPLHSAINRLLIRPLSHEVLKGDLQEGNMLAHWNGKEMEFKIAH